jgi:hypothetical protein
MALKINSTSKLKSNLYSAEFNDGILLNIRYVEGRVSGEPEHMCSLGTNSYFHEKGYWPKGHNLRKRLLMGTDMIKSRLKRYKRTSKQEE